MPSSISILNSVNWVEAKGGRWSAAPLGGGGSWLGVSRYVMMGEKAGCCSKEGGVGNILWRSATAERRQREMARGGGENLVYTRVTGLYVKL